jgi:Methyltransferase domain
VIRGFVWRVARGMGLGPTHATKKSEAPPIEWWYPAGRGSFEGREVILRELLGLFPPGRLIDLACGNGMYSIAAKAMGWDVTGVDARTVRMPMTPGVTWVQQDVREADVTGYDVILLMGLLYHLELKDQLNLLRRCSGTVTIIDTHHSNAPTHLEGGYAGQTYRELPAGHTAALADTPTAAWGNPTSFWATQPDLVRMLHDAGFRTILALVPPTLPNRTFYVCLPDRSSSQPASSKTRPSGGA